MQPAKLDLEIYKGSTYSKTIQWKTGDPLLPVDITGCSVNMQIKQTTSSTDVIDTLTTANSRITIDNAAQGIITMHFPVISTKDVTINSAVYDLDVSYPGGEPNYTIVYGKVKYINQVTTL